MVFRLFRIPRSLRICPELNPKYAVGKKWSLADRGELEWSERYHFLTNY